MTISKETPINIVELVANTNCKQSSKNSLSSTLGLT